MFIKTTNKLTPYMYCSLIVNWIACIHLDLFKNLRYMFYLIWNVCTSEVIMVVYNCIIIIIISETNLIMYFSFGQVQAF